MGQRQRKIPVDRYSMRKRSGENSCCDVKRAHCNAQERSIDTRREDWHGLKGEAIKEEKIQGQTRRTKWVHVGNLNRQLRPTGCRQRRPHAKQMGTSHPQAEHREEGEMGTEMWGTRNKKGRIIQSPIRSKGFNIQILSISVNSRNIVKQGSPTVVPSELILCNKNSKQ